MAEADKRPARVLVVDDERLIASTLADILKQEGYEIEMAFSGDDAVEKARDFRPHLLLSDVCMPGLNGIQAASKIVALFPDCKVLLISGQVFGVELASREPDVKFPILTKPIHPRDLLLTIALVLRGNDLASAA
jgi:two-component system alkaline phosphatase synthesis response regulator PhoP